MDDFLPQGVHRRWGGENRSGYTEAEGGFTERHRGGERDAAVGCGSLRYGNFSANVMTERGVLCGERFGDCRQVSC